MTLYYGTPVLFTGRRPQGALTSALEASYFKGMTPEEMKLTPEERNARPLCGDCGHFTSWGSDNYTPFGGYGDEEPPDPVFLCNRCVAKEICTSMTEEKMPQHWIPAAWEYRVAPLIGFKRAGSRGASWARWMKEGEPLPNGWVWR